MNGDKRKARRHRMRVDAWVLLEGGERCECALSDVSDSGARINVHDTDAIPDNFLLLLAKNGAARRRCPVERAQPPSHRGKIRDMARRARTRHKNSQAESEGRRRARSRTGRIVRLITFAGSPTAANRRRARA